MHQHPILTNEVSIKVCYIKVVNNDRFSKLFKLNVSNFNFVTISGVKDITNFKVTCGYPTFFLNIERMICGSVNGFAVSSFYVKNLVSFLNPNVQNFFKLCFARFGIVRPDFISNLNFLNANKPIRSIYFCIAREASITVKLQSMF